MKSLIPAGALDRHLAILGANGSGKTSVAKTGIVEPALEAAERVIIIDPTGVWWGLRMGRDGKKKGYQIYVFGGDRGDYPLRARDAEMLAEAFGTSTDSAVFDTSLMTVGERTAFFTEFAEAIRRKNRGPLKLVIDEAHLFMPQAGASFGGAAPAMLHAGNNLVSLGRSRGLRVTMISQRPAKLHKDSLTQAHSLIAMRLMAPQDRKAIADWISDQADPERGKEIIASLPSMKPGEAWIWAPQDNVLDRVKFPLPKSYDSSKAPAIGDGDAPQLSAIDMGKLTDKLKAVETDRKANDPKALKTEIIRLNSEIARMSKEPRIDDGAIQRAEQRGYAAGMASGRSHILAIVSDIKDDVARHYKEAERLYNKAFDDQKELPMAPPPQASRPAQINRMPEVDIERTKALFRDVTTPRMDGSDAPLPKGELAILIAAAQHPKGCTRQQLTVLTGYKRSTRDEYIKRLAVRGYVDTGERVTATEAGIVALGSDYAPLPTGKSLQMWTLNKLPNGERAILAELLDAHPEAVSRDKLTELTGYKRSTRDEYLKRLAARELIETTPGHATASANLFD